MTAQSHTAVGYATYWKAWLCLLLITMGMVFIGSKPVLILGMSLKALIIGLWFMHLRYERMDFVLCIVLTIFATGLLLFGLISTDGNLMFRIAV